MNGERYKHTWLLELIGCAIIVLVISFAVSKGEPERVEVAAVEEQWTTQRMEVRAYCPCEECCGEVR